MKKICFSILFFNIEYRIKFFTVIYIHLTVAFDAFGIVDVIHDIFEIFDLDMLVDISPIGFRYFNDTASCMDPTSSMSDFVDFLDSTSPWDASKCSDSPLDDIPEDGKFGEKYYFTIDTLDNCLHDDFLNVSTNTEYLFSFLFF